MKNALAMCCSGARLSIAFGFAEEIAGRAQTGHSVGVVERGSVTLAILCDGVAKHAFAQKAAEMTFRIVANTFAPDARELDQALRAAVMLANSEVYELARKNRRVQSMSTSIVVAAIAGTKAYVAHVGNSRAYLVRGDEVKQMTHDHTMRSTFITSGLLSEEDADSHPEAEKLSKSIGKEPFVDPEVVSLGDLVHGDRLILCSKAVYATLNDQDYAEGWESPPNRAKLLIAGCSNRTDHSRALIIGLHLGAPDIPSMTAIEMDPSENSDDEYTPFSEVLPKSSELLEDTPKIQKIPSPELRRPSLESAITESNEEEPSDPQSVHDLDLRRSAIAESDSSHDSRGKLIPILGGIALVGTVAAAGMFAVPLISPQNDQPESAPVPVVEHADTNPPTVAELQPTDTDAPLTQGKFAFEAGTSVWLNSVSMPPPPPESPPGRTYPMRDSSPRFRIEIHNLMNQEPPDCASVLAIAEEALYESKANASIWAEYWKCSPSLRPSSAAGPIDSPASAQPLLTALLGTARAVPEDIPEYARPPVGGAAERLARFAAHARSNRLLFDEVVLDAFGANRVAYELGADLLYATALSTAYAEQSSRTEQDEQDWAALAVMIRTHLKDPVGELLVREYPDLHRTISIQLSKNTANVEDWVQQAATDPDTPDDAWIAHCQSNDVPFAVCQAVLLTSGLRGVEPAPEAEPQASTKAKAPRTRRKNAGSIADQIRE